jgi:hypothetical protein
VILGETTMPDRMNFQAERRQFALAQIELARQLIAKCREQIAFHDLTRSEDANGHWEWRTLIDPGELEHMIWSYEQYIAHQMP